MTDQPAPLFSHAPPMEPAFEPPRPPAPLRLRATSLARAFFGTVANPAEVWRAAKLQLNRKAHRHAGDDAQLALYARVLPTGFLHFGYFDDPGLRPEDMSLSGLEQAQQRYAELLLEQVGDAAEPVLDVGCGMGGLSRMLRDRGFHPVALTPDRLQAAHVRATLPDVPVVRCKFEQIAESEHAGRYGTVFTSESLQYLKLAPSLPLLASVLRPGGRWVACDFFHSRPSADRSCHEWQPFLSALSAAGWRVSCQRDITAHVLPTLAYAHMWAARFGLPLMQFAFLRLRRKQPALHHLLGRVLGLLDSAARANVDLIDPAAFAARKRYVLLVMERA